MLSYLIMSSISNSTVSKLALAKEMFILGDLSGKKNTRVDRMLSILNFDFSVVTLIVVSCVDSGKNPKQRNGKAKKWDELLTELKTFYTNQSLIYDLDSLHDLRNSIQHGDIVPSEWDISRFKKITENFFNDICNQVYQNQISFETVSMASMLKSPHEKILMEHVERYITANNYPLAYQFLITAAVYHYMLIISNLKLPFGKLYVPQDTIAEKGITAEQGVEVLSTRLQATINRLAMGEHYLRLLEILKKSVNPVDLETPYYSLGKQEPIPGMTFLEIQEDLATMYNIISQTENWVTEKLIVDVPIIYGMHISDITNHSGILNYGIMSKLSIEKSELELYSDWKCENLEKTIALSKENNFHSLSLGNLKSDTEYFCKIEIVQEGDPDYNNDKSVNKARVKFKTIT